jgi:ATP/maltotriose-dependent transcriptional regulator MalT
MLRDDKAGAMASFRRALRHPDPWARAAAVLGGALAAENDGRLDAAEKWFTHSVRGFRRLGDRWGTMMCVSGLAGIRSIRGDLTGALDLFGQAQALEVELGQAEVPAMTQARIAEQRYRMGDVAGAARELERALVVSQEKGLQAVEILVRCRLSTMVRVLGDLAAGRAQLTAARRTLRQRTQSKGDPMPSWLDSTEIQQFAAEGDLDAARAAGGRALAGMCRGFMNDNQGIATAGERLAEVAFIAGDRGFAAQLLGASAALRGAMDVGAPEIRALLAEFGPAEQETLAEATRLPHDQALEVLYRGASTPPGVQAP